MRYKYIFFDLDGTITEPALGITNGIIYALDKFGIEVTDRTSLYKFIGAPLRDSFREFYGFTEEEVERAVALYREYYSDKGIIENEIMPGIEEALASLRNAGCKLYVATSKPEIYAKKILEHIGLDSYFDIVAGSQLDGSRDNKELVLRYLLETSGINHVDGISSTVMVGDRKFDIEGAKAVGIDHIGVTFGYGDKLELETAGALKIVDTAKELTEYILEF